MPRTSRSWPAALVVVVAASGCLPDPEEDYEDFKARTADLGPAQTGSGAGLDIKPPDVATSSLYVGICVTALAGRDPEQALRFYTKGQFTPDGAGGGKLSLEVTPLRGWDTELPGGGDYVKPTSLTVSRSQTRGEPILASDLAVAPQTGRFTATLGTLNLIGEANSISGRDAVIEGTVLEGRFGEPVFCATLAGQLKVPYEYTFDPKENGCLFVKVNEGDPVPRQETADFVCPL